MITQKTITDHAKQSEIIETAVSYAIAEIVVHLRAASIACVELALRLQSSNVSHCRRDEASQASCQAMECYPIEYGECVQDACIEHEHELTDDEQIVAAVRAEVRRRVEGLIALLG